MTLRITPARLFGIGVYFVGLALPSFAGTSYAAGYFSGSLVVAGIAIASSQNGEAC